MINTWLLTLVCIAYVGLLFAIARWGDRTLLRRQSSRARGVVYSLALAVYCTSWTFYGAVGSAANAGWLYLPIYLGPILTIMLAWPLIERIIAISRRQRLTTIADFISARYGRSRGLGVLVTLIATVGSVPYIALQLKAIVTSFATVAGGWSSTSAWLDPALIIALGLAAFAILFGTRKVDITEHHNGMMLAIAFESVVKLFAFLAIGALALWMLGSGAPAATPASTSGVFTSGGLPATFLTQVLLAGAAILCLPRQFHVAIVEARTDADTAIARWLFPVYLVLFSLSVIPITLAGLRAFQTAGVAADTFVLALPMSLGNELLAMLAFVGGFSAATSMVIVACVALSTMISNEIVVPTMVRIRAVQGDTLTDFPRLILTARRVAIVVIALLALAYFRVTDETTALASIGLLSFAAAAQFAPLIVLGVYWPGANRIGALGGLSAGFALWAFTLFLPALARSGALPISIVEQGLFGWSMLRPEALLFDTGLHPLTHGVLWSLGANLAVLVGVSLTRRQRLIERSQAYTFVGLPDVGGKLPDLAAASVTIDDLQALAARFVGAEHARRSFADLVAQGDIAYHGDQTADMVAIRFTEKLLSGAIGAASARVVVSSTLRQSGSNISDVLMLLDETGEAIRFNRQLLEATLENMSQGVSVVDDSQRLIGWNRRYLELMNYSETLVYVGQPITELIRHNAALGRFGDEAPDAAVAKRLAYLRSGSSYTYESQFVDGKVIQIRGQPMTGGGYVTTYTDITAFKEAERELTESRDQLEQRVADRTAELRHAMDQLASAKQDAEVANRSKTHFLAAAAHDLLQPLNATKLFAALLQENSARLPSEQRVLVDRVQSGLGSVESLLTALLDIAKLDAAAPTPKVNPIPVSELFRELETQFAPLFENENLELRFVASDYWIRTDASLVRRILQNFISNARRYTDRGGVLVGCRLRGDELALQVVDTGSGIPVEHHEAIFEEFRRLPGSAQSAKRGLGLGLAIVRRIARLLEHPIAMRSVPGRGSTFEVSVPRAPAGRLPEPVPDTVRQPTTIISEHVICVDNESDILDAMAGLLSNWGAIPTTAADQNEAVEAALGIRRQARRWPAILLVDYHLDGGVTGLDVIDAVRKALGQQIPAIVLTADHTDAVAEAITARGHRMLRKPVKPAVLRALINSLLGRRSAA
ncbi:MAG: PAS domain-containing hybrid sensor histidine kinase/response regulator [Pseudomonadota bacterium]